MTQEITPQSLITNALQFDVLCNALTNEPFKELFTFDPNLTVLTKSSMSSYELYQGDTALMGRQQTKHLSQLPLEIVASQNIAEQSFKLSAHVEQNSKISTSDANVLATHIQKVGRKFKDDAIKGWDSGCLTAAFSSGHKSGSNIVIENNTHSTGLLYRGSSDRVIGLLCVLYVIGKAVSVTRPTHTLASIKVDGKRLSLKPVEDCYKSAAALVQERNQRLLGAAAKFTL